MDFPAVFNTRGSIAPEFILQDYISDLNIKRVTPCTGTKTNRQISYLPALRYRGLLQGRWEMLLNTYYQVLAPQDQGDLISSESQVLCDLLRKLRIRLVEDRIGEIFRVLPGLSE